MGISVNGPSGIDTAYIIDSLVALEHNKVDDVQKRVDDYKVKIDAYSQLKSLIDDIITKSLALDREADFNIFNTASSNEALVTFRAGVGAVEGVYDVGVYQLASSEKMVSADGLITSQSASLSSLGITVGDISINGTTITIDDDDTIQDLRLKVNSATDADGKKIGVTATVLKISDTNFRLLLSASDDGAAGAVYQDSTGSTLQDLGIILDAAGTKGNTNQGLESAIDVQSAFAALGAGESIAYSGTDRYGNVVTNLFVKDAASTIDDFLANVEATFHGMADVAIDGAGKLVITDKVAGPSQLNVTSFSMGGAASDINIVQAGKAGAGVLSVGKDAFYSIDGILMQSDSNTPDGVIAGVTLELHKASVDETVRLDMSRDFDSIVGKIQEFFDAFNAVLKFSRDETSYGDLEAEADGEENTSKGALAGDMTLRNIVNQFRVLFQQQFPLLGTDYKNIAEIGIKTDAQSGEMKVDSDKLKSALEDNFDSVINLFITKGYSDNANIVLGRHTEDTQAGKYVMEEVDANYLRIRLEGSADWYTSNPRVGDVVTFGSGPASGLSITAPAGSIAGSASFTFSKGLAELANELASRTTDSKEGTIAMRQETWRRSIDRSEDRIDRLERSIESYRLRLVKEFSVMEQNLASMQQQSLNMLSQLGYYSSG